jgi:hypothetical protein
MRLSIAIAALGLIGSTVAQAVPIPPFGSTFTATLTRGFWFQAPANGIVAGIAVPNEASQPFQAIEFIDLGASPPPAFPGTVVGTQLFYDNSSVGGSTVGTAIPIISGNYYGVLGACTSTVGSNNSFNSYAGATGPFASTILGVPTTLTRFGTQFGIGAGGNQPCWSEVAGTFCRVELTIIPSGGGTIATNTTLGQGCVSVADVSSYELFATSAGFDLASSGISLIHTGSGYLAIPLSAPYVAPSGSASVLALTDDSETTVTLSQPMRVGATGSTTTLTVCSNGFISAATGNGTGFTPAAATFLNGPQAWWSLCWHDYNPAIAGSGQVKFEQIGNIAYITWDGVWDFGGTSVADANTMQAQFDVTTGSVNYVYQTTSVNGNARLVGFSDGGASNDPGSMDISAALPATYSAATFRVLPLTLAAGSRPVTGTSWNLNVSNVPAAGLVGVDLFGFADPNVPDLSLLGLGQAGCQLRSTLDALLPYITTGNTHSYSFAIPANPALINFHLFTQSAVLTLPNLANTLTTGGIDGRVGDL